MPTDLSALVTGAEAELLDTTRSALDGSVAEIAAVNERDGALRRPVLDAMAALSLLSPGVPATRGGRGASALEVGLILHETASISASLACVVNVQNMVVQTVGRWAGPEQAERILAPSATGEVVTALAMTEPHAGSDLSTMKARVTTGDGGPQLDGTKCWVTAGDVADLFVVIVAGNHGPVAYAVPRSDGIRTTPSPPMLGLRAAGLATIELAGCPAPDDARIGEPGFGLSLVAGWALLHGRLGVAWMAAGVLAAALRSASEWALGRTAFGRPIIEHGQVRSAIASAGADLQAAWRLCVDASRAVDEQRPDATDQVITARLFACRAAATHTHRAVQVLGARGCVDDEPAARGYRDAKVLEILDGTTEMMELLLAEPVARHAARGR